MDKFCRLLSRYGLLYSTLWARKQILETRIRIKKIFNGFMILWLSTIFWIIGFMMIFGSIFFYFSDLSKYSIPSLLTGFLSLGMGLIVTMIGLYCLRSGE